MSKCEWHAPHLHHCRVEERNKYFHPIRITMKRRNRFCREGLLVFCLASLLLSYAHGATRVKTRHLSSRGNLGRYEGRHAESVKPITVVSISTPEVEASEPDLSLTDKTISNRHAIISPFQVPNTWVIGEGQGKKNRLQLQNRFRRPYSKILIHLTQEKGKDRRRRTDRRQGKDLQKGNRERGKVPIKKRRKAVKARRVAEIR